MAVEQPKSSIHRTEVNEVLTKKLFDDGAPGDIINIWVTEADTCYCAYLAGKAAAQHMALEGEIEQKQVPEIAMEFAKILAAKVGFRPKTPDLGGIVVPRIQGLN